MALQKRAEYYDDATLDFEALATVKCIVIVRHGAAFVGVRGMEEAGQQAQKKVIVDYPGMDEAIPVFVSGAFGFVTPDTLTMHFYAESFGYGDQTEHDVVNRDGTEAVQMQGSPSPIDADGNFHLVRRNVCSVVMTKTVLAETAQWLQQKLAEMEMEGD